MTSWSKLYVVSDLHIGGAPERSLFQEDDALAALVDGVHNEVPPEGGTIGFVLNGDVLDLLAEPGAIGLEPETAAERVRRAIGRAPKTASALGRLAASPSHALVVVLGNHDIELALPDAQRAFCEALEVPRARLRFATDGRGFTCEVGNATAGWRTVWCCHGDIADVSNVVDQKSLSRVVTACEQGDRPPRHWESFGTMLVLKVVNPLKSRYPIIDLLKPEIGAAVQLAAVLAHRDEDGLKEWRAVARAFLAQAPVGAYDGIRRAFGYLSEGDGAVNVRAPGADPVRAGTDLIESVVRHEPPAQAVDLLDDEDLLTFRAIDAPVLFGWRSADAEWLRRRWRTAVDAQNDEGPGYWHPRTPDATFEYFAKHTPRDVHFAVVGHTHIRRAIGPRSRPWRGSYLNTGTWARLMSIPYDLLNDPKAFGSWVTRVGKHKTLKDLLEDKRGKPLTHRQRTVAIVRPEAGQVVASLFDVLDGKGAPARGAPSLGDKHHLAEVGETTEAR